MADLFICNSVSLHTPAHTKKHTHTLYTDELAQIDTHTHTQTLQRTGFTPFVWIKSLNRIQQCKVSQLLSKHALPPLTSQRECRCLCYPGPAMFRHKSWTGASAPTELPCSLWTTAFCLCSHKHCQGLPNLAASTPPLDSSWLPKHMRLPGYNSYSMRYREV